jgi:hypothetical protein
MSRSTVVGGVATMLLLATTVSVDGAVTPLGIVSTPAAVSDELLNPDGGPEGPHDQAHPALGQPLVAVMDIVDPPELRYAA